MSHAFTLVVSYLYLEIDVVYVPFIMHMLSIIPKIAVGELFKKKTFFLLHFIPSPNGWKYLFLFLLGTFRKQKK